MEEAGLWCARWHSRTAACCLLPETSGHSHHCRLSCSLCPPTLCAPAPSKQSVRGVLGLRAAAGPAQPVPLEAPPLLVCVEMGPGGIAVGVRLVLPAATRGERCTHHSCRLVAQRQLAPGCLPAPLQVPAPGSEPHQHAALRDDGRDHGAPCWHQLSSSLPAQRMPPGRIRLQPLALATRSACCGSASHLTLSTPPLLCQAPIFEMDFFQHFVSPTLWDAFTGWGLDFVW